MAKQVNYLLQEQNILGYSGTLLLRRRVLFLPRPLSEHYAVDVGVPAPPPPFARELRRRTTNPKRILRRSRYLVRSTTRKTLHT